MKTEDAIDGEIRFTANCGGLDRFVFIPDPHVTDDAGYDVSRAEAIDYIRANLDRYRAEAEAQHGSDDPVKIVILKRG